MPRKRKDWPPCEVDEDGLNTAIKAHVLSDDTMRSAGFKRIDNAWYYLKNLDRDISFNVTIDVDTEKLRIDVLDEMFLQPFDYQAILRHNGDHPIANPIYHQVEHEMARLTELGIISGHVPGEYI